MLASHAVLLFNSIARMASRLARNKTTININFGAVLMHVFLWIFRGKMSHDFSTNDQCCKIYMFMGLIFLKENNLQDIVSKIYTQVRTLDML